MWWPFKKKNKPDDYDIVHELWEPRFSSRRKSRFLEITENHYDARYERGVFVLTLGKKHLFAWAENPLYRYEDFSLESEISFSSENGHSAAGFLVRYVNEANYYYFLISNQGMYRFDLVFNGTPVPLVPWTSCRLPEEPHVHLRVLAHGSHFSFFLGDSWIGEIENDSIGAGGIAFAGQNYGDKDRARLTLHTLTLESRPIEVERLYYRWNRYVPAEPEQRKALAESLCRQRHFAAAAVQLKKISRERSLWPEELLLLSECFIEMGFPKEALKSIEKVIEIQPDNPQALIGKANLLYSTNRLLELKELLPRMDQILPESSVLQNLAGNMYYTLGESGTAAGYYDRASSLEPGMPLFLINAGRAYERLKDYEKAIHRYSDAARLLFKEEAYDELSSLLHTIFPLSPDNPDMKALEGKMLFDLNRLEEAETILRTLEKRHTADSTVYYLLGILEVNKGDVQAGYPYFVKATELEPDFALYWFKRAESEMVLNQPVKPSLLKALELDPDDLWIRNLAGQFHLAADEPVKALDHLEKAWNNSEKETDILLNYSEALYLCGRKNDAFTLLRERDKDSRVFNQLGNLYAKEGDFQASLGWYEKALNKDRDNVVYTENCAAVCIELDLLSRAEELLVPLLDRNPGLRVYTLLGNVAWLKGEFSRAEEIFRQGIENFPFDPVISINLAELYVQRTKYSDALAVLDQVDQYGSFPRAEKLKDRIRDLTETTLTCASCGREWSVDNDIPPQPPLKLRGELPGESPAGQCPVCRDILCIACAKATLQNGRFTCPRCAAFLKLTGDHIRFIVKTFAGRESRDY